MSMNGQKVVVTGGSSGIGLATAQALVERGAGVIIASRSPEKLEKAGRMLGPEAETHTLDVTREEEVKAFFEKIGPFDHLITAASGVAGGGFLDLGTAAARALFESKFWGQYHAVKYGAPFLRKGGSITLFSGFVSRKPLAGFSTYAAIDGAIESLARVLALELAPLRVNVVTPGLIDTPAWESMPEEARSAQFAAVATALLVKRVGRAEDVVKAILYLIDNAFATGAIIDVDGGHRCI